MNNKKNIPVPKRDHFSHFVSNWSHFGSPMRPAPDDTVVMQREASALDAGTYVAVLGLTSEIIGCEWPADVKLSAIDHSPAMMERLWPPAKGPANAEAILADWLHMPFEAGTFDLVAGDGCYVLLLFPEGYEALTREVHRVLRPGGRFVIRVFMRPDEPETVNDIGLAVGRGEIGSVHALKLRLLAAVHGASGLGSRLDDAWQAWKAMPPLPESTVGKPGWTAEEIVCLETYAGMDTRYYLPTLAEFRQCIQPFLTELDCVGGRYELANRCPTLVFARDN